MIKKMYSNYEINKKYAIRKLSIGAFSIAIGLFASNMNELPVISTHLGPNIVHAAEPEVTNWQPEGNIIAQGEDGVPWELYENGYLLFKPEPGKNELTNEWGGRGSWKINNGPKIRAIGFTDKVYAPEDSSWMFSKYNNYATEFLTNLKYIDSSKIDTSKVINMENMFYGISSLTNLDVSRWDTSKVTNMSYMFYEARGLTDLNVSNWNTGNVTNMSFMFDGASNLTNLDVSNWNTSNVTNMAAMFRSSSNLTNLNVSN